MDVAGWEGGEGIRAALARLAGGAAGGEVPIVAAADDAGRFCHTTTCSESPGQHGVVELVQGRDTIGRLEPWCAL